MKIKMNEIEWAAWVFTVLGAVNAGLIGLFKFDIVGIVFSTSPYLARIVYALIVSSGLYWIYKMMKT